MLKKYHLVISVTFWTLITAIAALFTLSQVLPDFKPLKYLFGVSEKTIVEKSSQQSPQNEIKYVAQTQYKEIEKKVEWYYFVATGYSGNDAAQGTGQKTATGKNIFKGLIAVDPKIIPYGTELEIKNIGYFVAEDSGSKIKGNRIDIYFESKAKANEFGKQGVWVRFVGNVPVEIAQITTKDIIH